MEITRDPLLLALAALGLILYFLLAERWLAARFPAGKADDEYARLAGRRRFGMINALIALAPLLGLLGTVRGVTAAFQELGAGAAASGLAGGIRLALYSTEYGLALALPAYLLARALEGKGKK